MNLELFYTAQNLNITPGKGASKALGGEGSMLDLQGLSFMDFIFAQIGQQIKEQESTQGETPKDLELEKKALDSDNPLLADEPELNIAALIAANPEIEEEVKEFIHATQLDAQSELDQTIALNQQAFDSIMKKIEGLIVTDFENVQQRENGKPQLWQALLIKDGEAPEEFTGNFGQLVSRIKELIEEEDPALINTNLAPAELTLLENKSEEELEELQDSEELQAVIAGFVVFTLPRASQASENAKAPNVAASVAQAVQNSLSYKNIATGVQTPGTATPLTDAAGLAAEDAGDFDFDQFWRREMDRPLPNAKPDQAPANNNIAPPKLAVINNQGAVSPLPVLTAQGLAGLFELPEGFFAEHDALPPLGQNALQMASLTQLTTQAPHASAPHPATQMVAMSMQKMGLRGENTQFSIQLDPPDLGRIEVELNFSKNKTVKAALMIEKPETYLMMQRDAQLLERTLQDMGLDADGGISFELAEQGFDFDDHNQRGGGHDKGGTGAGDEEELDIIETTMTWQVDSETGHVRYDIWA